jgi:hypothetical protein
MVLMRAYSVRRVINSRLKKKYVCQNGVIAVTRERIFTAEGLADGVSVVM